jgi:hypothetical protein
MTQDEVNAMTIGNVTSWLMQPERTPDELIQCSAVVKMRFEDSGFAGQTRKAFEDVSAQADAAQREKFGG